MCSLDEASPECTINTNIISYITWHYNIIHHTWSLWDGNDRQTLQHSLKLNKTNTCQEEPTSQPTSREHLLTRVTGKTRSYGDIQSSPWGFQKSYITLALMELEHSRTTSSKSLLLYSKLKTEKKREWIFWIQQKSTVQYIWMEKMFLNLFSY